MESSGVRPARRRPARAALAALVVLGGTAMGTACVTARTQPDAVAVSSAGASPSATTRAQASVEPVAQPQVVDHDGLLAEAMRSVEVADGVSVSVAVLDLESGSSAVYGDGGFDTASIVKVDILAALLLQAQDAGRSLTASERAYATAMIERSDNASASALWRSIGQADGLDAANRRFGLTDTVGGDGMLWGLTRTTAADQLTLLRQVFEADAADSELDEASRTYLEGLMGDIAADQDWGVSAAADGSAWALKNGWLPRSATGLWDVNSIGRVTVGGRDYLVAALSDGNATKAAGVSVVEAAARAAVPVPAGAATTPSPAP